MKILVDDLSRAQVIGLIAEHLQGMAEDSPPESIHALNLDGLKQPEITFWCAWEDEELLGCGAIKELNKEHAELKSMRTARKHLRKGVARTILAHIIEVAVRRGYKRISLGLAPWIHSSPPASCMKISASRIVSRLQIISRTRIADL